MMITKKEAEDFQWEIKTLDIVADRIDRKLMVNRELGDMKNNHDAQALILQAMDLLSCHPDKRP